MTSTLIFPSPLGPHADFLTREIRDNVSNFTDVDVVCEEGSFHVHSLILAAMSPFLSEQLSTMEEKVLILPDVPGDIFRSLLDFVYSGKAVLAKDDVINVVKLGKALKVKAISGMVLTSEAIKFTGKKPAKIDLTEGQTKPGFQCVGKARRMNLKRRHEMFAEPKNDQSKMLKSTSKDSAIHLSQSPSGCARLFRYKSDNPRKIDTSDSAATISHPKATNENSLRSYMGTPSSSTNCATNPTIYSNKKSFPIDHAPSTAQHAATPSVTPSTAVNVSKPTSVNPFSSATRTSFKPLPLAMPPNNANSKLAPFYPYLSWQQSSFGRWRSCQGGNLGFGQQTEQQASNNVNPTFGRQTKNNVNTIFGQQSVQHISKIQQQSNNNVAWNNPHFNPVTGRLENQHKMQQQWQRHGNNKCFSQMKSGDRFVQTETNRPDNSGTPR